MRPIGETGVQTHIGEVKTLLTSNQVPHKLLTPFSYNKSIVYPVFSLRKLIFIFHKPFSVWWYRYWHALFLQKSLTSYLNDEKPCIIYAQCPLSAKAALSARKSIQQKVVMAVHFNISQANEWADKGLIKNDDWLFKSIVDFECKILSKLDGIIYVSDFMKKSVETRIPEVQRVSAKVIPNFINDPGKPAYSPSTTLSLITIGTLEDRKNHTYGIDIIKECHNQGNRVSLTIIGDGPNRKALEQKVKALNLEHYITFLGYKTNAATFISQHTAYIQVSKMESFGITLIEAMARGTPVFATKVGGMPEVFENNIHGQLLPLNDAISAAQIINAFLVNPINVSDARYKCREYFLKNFELNIVSKKLLKFFSTFNKYDS
jgi:glycosyltransferase involved in cell wall biosynthesis